MSKLINLLNKNKLTLIAALPENSVDLALTAVENGADALQLHINIKGFKTFAEEKNNLEAILNKVDVPVGIVPGHEDCANEEEMKEIARMGFDYFSIDLDLMPEFMQKFKRLSRVLALNSKFTLDKLITSTQEGLDALDAAIIPTSGWGKDLVVGDLQQYISIVLSAGKPVIVPTQRAIRTSEVAIISDTGAKGLLLTPVVMGASLKHIAKAVKEYRIAVDDLGD
ncbi:MAG: hypothetical protein KKA31_02555 [Candidatus Margulisbacteria bacterium]|nr:hypothetical protein [Candidatus Margulisiibacteriota bacterium]